jgi:N4-gp56 family major capsid protein
MAVTRKADVAAQIPQLWATELLAQAEKLTFWHRFEGPEGSSMPVIRKDDLERQPGDTIKFDIVMALTGSGTTGDTTLTEGNEEKITFRQTSMSLTYLKHAVRWSELSETLITHDMRVTALNQLRKWLSGKIDDRIFNEFTGSGVTTVPDKNRIMKASGTLQDAGVVNSVTATDLLTLDDITALKAYAKADVMIEPLRLDGGSEVYGLVVHPFVVAELKKSAAYQQAMREAQVRGDENPLFTGASAVWDGVIIYESARVPRATNSSSVHVARNIFFGAQALVRGYGMYPKWVEQEFSYGEEVGIATRVLLGEKLVVFDLNATETPGSAADDTAIGCLNVYTAAPVQVA